MENRNIIFFILLLFFVSVYVFVFSDSGLLKREILKNKIQFLNYKKEKIKNKIKGLDEIESSPLIKRNIMLMETYKLGYAFKNSKIYYFKDKNVNSKNFDDSYKINNTKKILDKEYKLEFYWYYGRILWIVLSFLSIILFYLYSKTKRND